MAQEVLEKQLNSFKAVLGQEKIYIQTDRTFYKPGQNIWFSVYVLNEALLFSDKSKFIRVELINPSGAVQQNVLLKYDSTKAIAGDFLIDEKDKGGWYQLRVYTDWMEKTTQPYFEKSINIQSIVYSNVLMELDFERESYGPGSAVRANLNLRSLSNQAIVNKKVNYTIALEGKVITTTTVKTNEAGKALIQFKLPTSLNNADGLINFKVEYQGIVESISRGIPILLNEIDLQFLPEGGNYVLGAKQKIAFMARDEFGAPADIAGIVRLGKDTISHFRSYHQGMGSFIFVPQISDKKYNIQITEPLGMRTNLPFEWEGQQGDFTLNILEQDSTTLKINLLAAEAQEVSIVLQIQGELPFYHRFKTQKGDNWLSIPTDSLPIGIVQVTVFNASLEPQTERLVFVNKHKQLQVKITTNKTQYQPREEVQLSLEVLDEDSIPVQGVFSLAVVDEKNITMADDKQDNILSQLLLSADLKGKIYEPNFYFDPTEPKADTALDYVLLTQGWRRFEWKNLMQEQISDWQKRIKKTEKNYLIKGLATVNDIPLKNQLVLLEKDPNRTFVAPKKRAIIWTKTNEKGEFTLEKDFLPFPSYLSVNYRGLWSSAHLKKAQTGIYEAKVIESENINPYVSRPNNKSIAYDNNSYDRNSRRNYNGNYGRAYNSVDLSYDHSDWQGSRHYHQTGVDYKGVVRGRVEDNDFMEGLAYTTVVLTQEGTITNNMETDDDGNFFFYGINAGTYTLSVQYPGYETYQVELVLGTDRGDAINICMATATVLDALVDADGNRGVVTVTAYHIPLIEHGATTAGSLRRSSLSRSRSLMSMSRSQKSKLKIANKRTNNILRRGITKPKPIQYTSSLVGGSYGPSNRYNFLDEQMDWKANTSIRFNLQQVKALAYYKARTFISSKPYKYQAKSNFKETVYWAPSIATNSEGKAKLSFYNSDAISTFRMVVEGQGEGNLGRQEQCYITANDVEIQAKIPSLISLGDTLILPIVIRNNTKKEFNGILEIQLNNKYHVLALYDLVIPAEGSYTQQFPLVIAKTTQKEQKIILKFNSHRYKEQSTHRLKILQKGFPKEYAISSNESLFQQKIQIDAPIDSSLEARFYASPNPLNALSKSILGIVEVPSGCFEQVSASNYPNVLALQYMDAMGIDAIEKRTEILSYLKLGYDKLVAYETKIGGFEWYGKTPPHLGLTAHGLLQFHEMQGVFGGVDALMMKRVRKWILDTRDGAGGFVQEGGKYAFSNQNKSVTNAYVIHALSVVNQKGIEKELEVATLEALKSKDLYRVSLLALSHWNYNNKRTAKELLSLLEGELKTQNLSDITAETTITNSYGRSLNIEVVAIAMLASLTIKPNKKALLEVCRRHLLSQRKGGVFGNTQGTIWALKALIEYEKKYGQKQAAGEYVLTVNGKVVKEITYNKRENGQIDLKGLAPHFQQGENTIEIVCKVDKGTVPPYSLEVDWRELLPKKDTACQVEVSTIITNKNPRIGETVRLTTTLKNKSDQAQASTVALIGIPAGLSLQAWQIKALQDQNKVDYIELMEDYVVLHYRDLQPKEEQVIHLDLKTEFVGFSQGPANSAYLYYQNELKDWSAGAGVEVLP